MAKHRTVLQVLTGAKTAAQFCPEHQFSEQLLSSWKNNCSLTQPGLHAGTRVNRCASLARRTLTDGWATDHGDGSRKKSLAALAPSLEKEREMIEMLKSNYPINLLRRPVGHFARLLH